MQIQTFCQPIHRWTPPLDVALEQPHTMLQKVIILMTPRALSAKAAVFQRHELIIIYIKLLENFVLLYLFWASYFFIVFSAHSVKCSTGGAGYKK